MVSSPGWIRQFHKSPAGRSPLVIFPHAGSGASAYRAMSKSLSSAFDVRVVQYPGRQDRVHEPAATALTELAAASFAEFTAARPAGPLTIVGHSMGAIVAFEFARLAETSGIPVRLLAASAATAPSLVEHLPKHPTEDDELLAHMNALNGTSADVLGSSELVRMALPVLKADYRAFDAYDCDPDAIIDAPIMVLGGESDPFVTPRDLYAWREHTRAEVSVTLFEGGHFYLNDHLSAVAEIISAPSLCAR
ncbi:thioesterase [Skermania sp. ID1734]|uniref:thioesterase II family protein n=1 Tax=Skermania sp. ID1734 TaxID=2597516 RepID=UPI001181668A|nr:alpha/beta fold hydrolase [Skermania sp. ID1734]TSE01435.1 thioesterase [Skermania sp. ID1734]